MTDSAFKVKNGLNVNNGVFIVDPGANSVTMNVATINIPGGTINSTAYSGTAQNVLDVGLVTAANVVSNSQLQANLANYATTAGLAANVQALVSTNNQVLTFANPITWNASNGNMATITLTGNNSVVSAPTSAANGSLVLIMKQDASGNRHVTWNAIFKWPAGIAPTLSTAANATDILSFIYDGTNMYGTFVTGLA